MLSPLLLTIIQIFLVALLAPLSAGVVKKIKARLQGRHGASVFLPYFTLLTLLRKELVISKSTSWVFRLVPFAALTLAIFPVAVLPLVVQGGALNGLSNFLIFSGVLALGSVFLVLGGLDSASAFGGMGSSRELTIAALVEPAVILVFAAFAVVAGTTQIDGLVALGAAAFFNHPFLILSAVALVLIALAENARYPVDNPATHLELTMVHEAMLLEYSGPYLAFLEYASMLKMTLFSLLLANFFFPSTLLTTHSLPLEIILSLGFTILKIFGAMFLLAFLESTIAKMRFYRLHEYFIAAFCFALGGFILALIHTVS
jgi:formate hydrogenlyase subunit 4